MPPIEALQQAADLINKGSKVAILAGQGCLGAKQELLALAERAAAPIIKSLLGKAAVPDRSALTTGGIGLLGTSASQDAMDECDTLIILGCGMPYLEFYPKPGKARCVQIDIDASRIGLRYPVDVGLTGDCRSVITALLPLLQTKQDRAFLEKSQERMTAWRKLMEERGTRTDMPMKPQVVTHNLNLLLNDDAIVITDSGTITTWTARHVDMRGDMQFAVSGTLASMANGLPYAIGAACAFPERQIVCVIGDGGLSMLMAELVTLKKYAMNVTVVVIKNNVLGQIKWEQMVMEGNPEFGVELEPIDFAGVARACGIAAFSLVAPGEAENVLREALNVNGPALVEAVIDPNEPPLPGHIKTEQALKFAESLMRGEKDAGKIIKNVLKNQVREVL